jgi:hypothetical protein
MGYVTELVRCGTCGTANAKGEACWYCEAKAAGLLDEGE